MSLDQVVTSIFSLLCLLSVVYWIVDTFRLRPRLRVACPLGFIDVVVMFMAWVFAQIIVTMIYQMMNQSEEGISTDSIPTDFIFMMGTGQLMATFACLGLFCSRYGSPTAFGWSLSNLGRDIKIGLFGFLLIVPPAVMLQSMVSRFVQYQHSTLETLAESESSLPIVATWFSAVLVAPIIEEIFYRGVLLGWLQRLGNTRPEDFGNTIFGGWYSDRKSGKQPESKQEAPQVFFDSKLRWLPILVSSALFAAAHMGQGGAPIALFFFSIGLGYLYRQTGSLIPCILVHVLLNAYTMLWATLAVVLNQVN